MGRRTFVLVAEVTLALVAGVGVLLPWVSFWRQADETPIRLTGGGMGFEGTGDQDLDEWAWYERLGDLNGWESPFLGRILIALCAGAGLASWASSAGRAGSRRARRSALACLASLSVAAGLTLVDLLWHVPGVDESRWPGANRARTEAGVYVTLGAAALGAVCAWLHVLIGKRARARSDVRRVFD